MCVFSDKCKYCTNLKLIYLNRYLICNNVKFDTGSSNNVDFVILT
jgi:hypothetical protein